MSAFKTSLGHFPQVGAPSLLLSLPPEIRIMIYEDLAQNEQEYIRLKRACRTVKSTSRHYKGVFGLLLTSRLIFVEVQPIVQKYLDQSAHQISFLQLDQYMKSQLPTKNSVQKLRIAVHYACRFRSIDLLPLIRLQRQHSGYDIRFDMDPNFHQPEPAITHLQTLMEILGKELSFINTMFSRVQISWRDWPTPFITFIPIWYKLETNDNLVEYPDEAFSEFLGINHLRHWLEFRLMRKR
ncbi:hypothetical protein F5Y03DRAFT_401723 [Xylaria venustula]|nr:hypothetical protein F5Y03DRAFT_401723 [Xylaria venustula]